MLILSAFALTATGQNRSFKNNKFQWPEDRALPIAVDSQFFAEDAVILSEHSELEMIHNNQYDTYLYNVLLKKRMRIKFLTEEGVRKYSMVSLPESFDPISDHYRKPDLASTFGHQPKGDFDFMNYFVAVKINADGSRTPIAYTDSSETEDFYLNKYTKGELYFENTAIASPDKKSYAIHFKLSDLRPGDEVEIAYSVKHVFLTSRIFFHGTLPKQTTEFIFRYNSNQDLYFVSQFNNAMYTDSTNNYKMAEYRWVFNDLPGCLNETGARPYKHLPYISFYRHAKDYGDMNPATNEITVYRPYSWQIVMSRFATFSDENLETALNDMKDRSTLAFNRFYNARAFSKADSLPLFKVLSMHNAIVDSFSYQNDLDYYRGIDLRNKRFGEFTDNMTLREICRNEMYERIFRKLMIKYDFGYILDKRYEEMVVNRYAIPISLNNVYSISAGKQNVYFRPKLHRFGWYANEFPFYMEDVSVLLARQRIDDENQARYDWRSVDFLLSKTPFSTANENIRTTNVKVEMNKDDAELQFESKVSLKGQYSTLTRGYYQYDYKDHSVNPEYYHKVWEAGDGKHSWTVTSTSDNFPFEFAFTSKYSSKSSVKKGQEELQLSMKNWFMHVTEHIQDKKRNLPYYVDFRENDTYRYYIKCDQPITVLNASEFEHSVDNAYYNYVCRITQPQANVIMLESMLIRKAEVIPAEQVAAYAYLCRKINNLNNGVLRLK
jgi:hypothetical protein